MHRTSKHQAPTTIGRRSRKWMHVVALLACLLGSTSPLSAQPKLEEVFESISDNMSGGSDPHRVTALLLIALALALGLVAVKHWNTKQRSPKPLNSHRQLMTEVARRAGISRRKLAKVEPLARSQGMRSPLVLLLCPSRMQAASRAAKSPEQIEALAELARATRMVPVTERVRETAEQS